MINIINSFWGSSGYSSHGRNLANALNKLIKVKISTNLMPGWETQVNDAELEMIKREEDYETNLIITHPLNWKAHLNAKRNFVYLIWEGDKIPKWMVEECNNPKIEKIIVPSQHTYDAVMNTNCKIAVDVPFKDKFITIPHGHNPEDFYPNSQQPEVIACQGGGETSPSKEVVKSSTTTTAESGGTDSQNPPADFKFLANKGLRNLEDRGGIQYLIEAYLSEFTESNNVELILKINPAYGIPNLLKMFPNLKKKGIPKVTFIHTDYTKKQLNELYNSANVFVSPTRAEAFNLPCLEAMACGKPVITTDFGGQTDYCNSQNGWIIGGELTKVTHEVEYEGISWLTPDIKQLKEKLRWAFENPDTCIKKGKICSINAKSLTWDSTAKQISSLI